MFAFLNRYVIILALLRLLAFWTFPVPELADSHPLQRAVEWLERPPMGAETRLSLLNKWLYNAGFVDPANGRVRNPFGFLRAEEITDSQLLEELLILSEDFDEATNLEIFRPEPEGVAQRLLHPEHGIYFGPPGSGRTTFARYANHQLGSQSLGIYNDIDSAAEAVHQQLQSEKTGVFYLILDQQPAYSLNELADLLTGLQEMSTPGSSVWIKFFLPRTCPPTDMVQELPKIEQLFAQELSWSAKKLRDVLLQRLMWAFDWRDNQGLHNFSTEELISHVGGDVHLALARRVDTPRELLVETRRLVALALAGHTTPPALPLTRDVWQSFVTPTPSLSDPTITSSNASRLRSSAQLTPENVSPRAADTSATLLVDRSISSSSTSRPVLTIPMELDTSSSWVHMRYDQHVPTPGPQVRTLPYTETGWSEAPFWLIRRALERSNAGRSHYDEHEWLYLNNLGLIETRSLRVKENIGQEVGKTLLELLTYLQEFSQDLRTSDFAADIRLRLRREDNFLACYPWELIAHDGQSLLLEEVSLTRHLYNAKPCKVDRPPLRVLYVAPRPVLSADTWPGYDPALTADYSQDDHRYIPNDTARSFLANPDTASVRTFKELEQRLTLDSSISVIHFDGHITHAQSCMSCEKWVKTGTNCPTCGKELTGSAKILLAFEQDATDHTVAPVKIEELAGLVRRRQPALVVLYACNSAISPDVNQGTTGAAQQLLIEGARCVVGMQAPIYDVSVIRKWFTQTLYEQLSATGSIATATRAVRRKLEDTGAWWMPVVYLRVDDDPNASLFETAPGLADG